MPNKAQAGDRRLRWTLGPPLGWAVGQTAGLQGTATMDEPRYWLGALYFAMVSMVLWKGNVIIWFWLRGRPDWIVNARRRLLLVGGAVLAFSVPTSLLLFGVWFLLAGEGHIIWPVAWRASMLATLASALIFHIYETIDLITQRSREHAARQQLEYAKALAELSALKAQVDPHFMFNCLNTLVGLIETSPERATRFTVNLGDVYRYILQSSARELVRLQDEVDFLGKYHALLKLRFENGIELTLPDDLPESWIPPVSLQLLLENAVKHNDFSSAAPLRIAVEVGEGSVSMHHLKSRTKARLAAEGTGLQNLDERCRLILHRGIEVVDSEGAFAVTVPISSELVRGAPAIR